MRKLLTFSVEELTPYINWIYFFHAWGLSSKSQSEQDKLKAEALDMLHDMNPIVQPKALFGIYEANSDGDDLIVDGVRIPMLRQQQADNQICLCLSDFVKPRSMGEKDHVGVFATSVNEAWKYKADGDEYLRMLGQTLSDRLAEAAAERMHELVRKVYWGYAPNENLTKEQLHQEQFQGIRPAIGYPSLPDASINFMISDLLKFKDIGITLTESGMMQPHSSVSGFMFAHPKAHYFDLGKIGEDQLADYASRRGLPIEVMRKFLQNRLINR